MLLIPYRRPVPVDIGADAVTQEHLFFTLPNYCTHRKTLDPRRSDARVMQILLEIVDRLERSPVATLSSVYVEPESRLARTANIFMSAEKMHTISAHKKFMRDMTTQNLCELDPDTLDSERDAIRRAVTAQTNGDRVPRGYQQSFAAFASLRERSVCTNDIFGCTVRISKPCNDWWMRREWNGGGEHERFHFILSDLMLPVHPQDSLRNPSMIGALPTVPQTLILSDVGTGKTYMVILLMLRNGATGVPRDVDALFPNHRPAPTLGNAEKEEMIRITMSTRGRDNASSFPTTSTSSRRGGRKRGRGESTTEAVSAFPSFAIATLPDAIRMNIDASVATLDPRKHYVISGVGSNVVVANPPLGTLVVASKTLITHLYREIKSHGAPSWSIAQVPTSRVAWESFRPDEHDVLMMSTSTVTSMCKRAKELLASFILMRTQHLTFWDPASSEVDVQIAAVVSFSAIPRETRIAALPPAFVEEATTGSLRDALNKWDSYLFVPIAFNAGVVPLLSLLKCMIAVEDGQQSTVEVRTPVYIRKGGKLVPISVHTVPVHTPRDLWAQLSPETQEAAESMKDAFRRCTPVSRTILNELDVYLLRPIVDSLFMELFDRFSITYAAVFAIQTARLFVSSPPRFARPPVDERMLIRMLPGMPFLVSSAFSRLIVDEANVAGTAMQNSLNKFVLAGSRVLMTATPFSKGGRAAKNELEELLALAGASIDVRTAHVPWFNLYARSLVHEEARNQCPVHLVGIPLDHDNAHVRDMLDAYAMMCMTTWRLERVISLSKTFSRPTTIYIPRSIMDLVRIIYPENGTRHNNCILFSLLVAFDLIPRSVLALISLDQLNEITTQHTEDEREQRIGGFIDYNSGAAEGGVASHIFPEVTDANHKLLHTLHVRHEGECPVCMCDDISHPTVLLRCGHVLCDECASSLAAHSIGEGRVRCPMCRGTCVGHVSLALANRKSRMDAGTAEEEEAEEGAGKEKREEVSTLQVENPKATWLRCFIGRFKDDRTETEADLIRPPDNLQHFPSDGATAATWDNDMRSLNIPRSNAQDEAAPRKVVIFVNDLTSMGTVRTILRNLNINHVAIRGADSLARRQRTIDAFGDDPNVRILVTTYRLANNGLDLTSASVVILFDAARKRSFMYQAIGRVHRPGQSAAHVLVLAPFLCGGPEHAMWDRFRRMVDTKHDQMVGAIQENRRQPCTAKEIAEHMLNTRDWQIEEVV